MTFLLWLILAAMSWPLAILALLVYPIVWVLSIPFRIVGISVSGALDLLKGLVTLPRRLLGRGGAIA